MRKAEAKDAAAITELSNYCFGDAYTSEEEMRGFILDENNRVFLSEDEKGLTGAILFLNESKEELMENLDVAEEDYEGMRDGKKVLHHKFCIVREDQRGKGLMTEMLTEAVDSLKNEDIFGVIFIQTWIKLGEIPLAGVMDRVNYQKYKRQIRPWWRYADRTCNICNGRCKCDAMVYYRKL